MHFTRSFISSLIFLALSNISNASDELSDSLFMRDTSNDLLIGTGQSEGINTATFVLNCPWGEEIQRDNYLFGLEFWTPKIGYIYYPGYPIGFFYGKNWGGHYIIYGGDNFSFLSWMNGYLFDIGFASEKRHFFISETESREPTWAIHIGGIGLIDIYEDKHCCHLQLRCNLGLEMANRTIINSDLSTQSDVVPYFSLTPMVTLNLYLLNFHFGYNYVPKFSQLDGIVVGGGLSLPINSDRALQKTRANIINALIVGPPSLYY